MLNKKKKIDYNKKKLKNPYFNRDKKIPKTKYRFKYKLNLKNLIIFCIFFIFIIIVWTLFFSNVLRVRDIQITGLSTISRDSLESTVKDSIKTKKYLFFYNDNLVIMNKNDILFSISKNFNLQNINIKKKYPNTLIIDVKEKGVASIWQESQNNFYIDEDGGIIKENITIDNNNTFPIIENKGDLRIYEKNVPDQYNIKVILTLFNLYKLNENKFELSKIVVDNEPNTVKIVTKGGMIVLFNTIDEVDKQLLKLQSVSKDKKINLDNKNYIDLRFGDKIYFK